jgi:glycosyltransferase involved in cell wall biosynthesis
MTCHILYVVGQLRAGGLERQLCYLLETINRDRYRPAVAVWRYSEDDFYVRRLRAMEIPIYFAPSRASGASKLHWLRRLVAELNPEVIHSYSFHTNFGAWWATLGRKAVPIGSVRSDFARAVRESGYMLGKLCARWPRTQMFNSLAAAENARKLRSPFTPRKIIVARNALDLKRFASTHLSNGRTRIVGIGSLIPVKRWDRLVQAASQLLREGFDFSVQLVGDGPLRKALKEQAEKLRITDHIEFIGQNDDIPSLLSSATLLVHTSESEGCPNVVLEGMACGRPVIAMETGDIASLIDDGETGFVVSNGDVDMLVNRIATLLRNRTLCERMASASRAKAEREFGLNRLIDETLGTYLAAGWRDLSDVSSGSYCTIAKA